MLVVDCPLCDAPAPFETATGELDCQACGVVLEVAADPGPLAAAA